MKKILIIVGAILLVGLVAAGSFWDVMTLSTAMDVTTVNLSASTQVEKSATASVADLQPGMQVTVTGQRDSNGRSLERVKAELGCLGRDFRGNSTKAGGDIRDNESARLSDGLGKCGRRFTSQCHPGICGC